MKKVLFCAAILAVSVAVVLGAGRLFADGEEKKAAKEPSPLARIALLNLTYVIKNYDKYNDFQREIKNDVEPFHKRDKKLKKLIEEAEQQKEKAKGNPKEMEAVEEKLKQLKREVEDNQAEVKKSIGKKSDEEMLILFKDVFEAAKHYAAGNGIELVLHYNDAVTDKDFMSPQNIARKFNTDALMPLYAASGLDISREIVKSLNESMHKK